VFTGIVEEMGTVLALEPGQGGSARIRIGATKVLAGLEVGDSVAVNGACLTVVELDDHSWCADAVAETLSRTNLADLATGDRVNLERALRMGDRLGGHLVQGHVDGVGTLVSAAPDLVVALPEGLARYLVPKGSVTVDGVSLTVVEAGSAHFSVAVIPHTAKVTTLGQRRVGERVNLELDLIAKYVERLLAAGASSPYLEQAPAWADAEALGD